MTHSIPPLLTFLFYFLTLFTITLTLTLPPVIPLPSILLATNYSTDPSSQLDLSLPISTPYIHSLSFSVCLLQETPGLTSLSPNPASLFLQPPYPMCTLFPPLVPQLPLKSTISTPPLPYRRPAPSSASRPRSTTFSRMWIRS